MNTLVSLIAGFLFAVALVGGVAFLRKRSNAGRPGAFVSVHSSIQQIKAIGQLSVFKVVTKEIVTEVDHAWGAFGKKYLSWILSEKKMAMIFEFEIDFRYDLRSPDFQIVESGGSHLFRMPPCIRETNLRYTHLYDEQKSRLVPLLLPDLVNTVLGDGFSVQDKNRLMDAAREAAKAQAESFVAGLGLEVEQSARQTLQSLARAFGAENVRFEFTPPGPPAQSPKPGAG